MEINKYFIIGSLLRKHGGLFSIIHLVWPFQPENRMGPERNANT
jgi:hypothetical protein